MDQPIYAQLFGDGFTYMEFIGSKFEETEIDHPHNVWISALLYGGVFGFVVTLWLTGYVFYLFFKRRASYSSMFYWYIMFLFLYFSSSNSIFSSRVFIVLVLFPFLNFNLRRKISSNNKN
jgi:O-antigen ligase